MAVPLMLMRPCFFSSAVRNHRTVFRSVPVLSLFISSKSLATFSLRRIHPTANDSFSKLQGFFFKRFNVRATDVSDSGSIDSSMMQSMEKKIKEQLNADFVTVKDAYGDGRHVSIYVISSEFEGQSAVNRQRMVYKTIWEELQSTVHAVDQMVTRTPTEAEATNN